MRLLGVWFDSRLDFVETKNINFFLEMSSSLLELIRFNHESAEALETVIGLELEQKPAGVS